MKLSAFFFAALAAFVGASDISPVALGALDATLLATMVESSTASAEAVSGVVPIPNMDVAMKMIVTVSMTTPIATAYTEREHEFMEQMLMDTYLASHKGAISMFNFISADYDGEDIRSATPQELAEVAFYHSSTPTAAAAGDKNNDEDKTTSLRGAAVVGTDSLFWANTWYRCNWSCNVCDFDGLDRTGTADQEGPNEVMLGDIEHSGEEMLGKSRKPWKPYWNPNIDKSAFGETICRNYRRREAAAVAEISAIVKDQLKTQRTTTIHQLWEEFLCEAFNGSNFPSLKGVSNCMISFYPDQTSNEPEYSFLLDIEPKVEEEDAEPKAEDDVEAGVEAEFQI